MCRLTTAPRLSSPCLSAQTPKTPTATSSRWESFNSSYVYISESVSHIEFPPTQAAFTSFSKETDFYLRWYSGDKSLIITAALVSHWQFDKRDHSFVGCHETVTNGTDRIFGELLLLACTLAAQEWKQEVVCCASDETEGELEVIGCFSWL